MGRGQAAHGLWAGLCCGYSARGGGEWARLFLSVAGAAFPGGLSALPGGAERVARGGSARPGSAVGSGQKRDPGYCDERKGPRRQPPTLSSRRLQLPARIAPLPAGPGLRCLLGVVVAPRHWPALSADPKEGFPVQDGGEPLRGRGRRLCLRRMAGAKRELRVLLAALSGEARGSLRDAALVRLSRGQDALGSLLVPGGIYLEPLVPSGGCRARGSVLPGDWAE